MTVRPGCRIENRNVLYAIFHFVSNKYYKMTSTGPSTPRICPVPPCTNRSSKTSYLPLNAVPYKCVVNGSAISMESKILKRRPTDNITWRGSCCGTAISCMHSKRHRVALMDGVMKGGKYHLSTCSPTPVGGFLSIERSIQRVPLWVRVAWPRCRN
jgi:hypothetical protein